MAMNTDQVFELEFGRTDACLSEKEKKAMISIKQSREAVYTFQGKLQTVDKYKRFWLCEIEKGGPTAKELIRKIPRKTQTFCSPFRLDQQTNQLMMVLNGKDLEPWSDEIRQQMQGCELIFTIKLTAFVDFNGYSGISASVTNVSSEDHQSMSEFPVDA